MQVLVCSKAFVALTSLILTKWRTAEFSAGTILDDNEGHWIPNEENDSVVSDFLDSRSDMGDQKSKCLRKTLRIIGHIRQKQ